MRKTDKNPEYLAFIRKLPCLVCYLDWWYFWLAQSPEWRAPVAERVADNDVLHGKQRTITEAAHLGLSTSKRGLSQKYVIEIDEAFFGGTEANKHEWKKLHAGRGAVGKSTVLGMRERGGRTRAKVTEVRSLDSIHGAIHGNVEVGSQLYTDDHMLTYIIPKLIAEVSA